MQLPISCYSRSHNSCYAENQLHMITAIGLSGFEVEVVEGWIRGLRPIHSPLVDNPQIFMTNYQTKTHVGFPWIKQQNQQLKRTVRSSIFDTQLQLRLSGSEIVRKERSSKPSELGLGYNSLSWNILGMRNQIEKEAEDEEDCEIKELEDDPPECSTLQEQCTCVLCCFARSTALYEQPAKFR